MIATQALIVINVAIWVGMYLYSRSHPDAVGDQFGDSIGLYAYALRTDHEYWRVISSGFLHFGIFHLAMNCWALYNLGSLMERVSGRLHFVALYFSSMAAGALGALILSPNSLTGGASGAIFGLLGASVMEMKSRGVPFMQSPLAGMLLINLVITFGIPGISIGGHVGGLAGGLIVGWANAQRHDPRIKMFRWAVPLAVFVVAVVGCIVVATNAAPYRG